MKKFFLLVFTFCIPVIIFSFLLDSFITQGLAKTESNRYKEWNDIFNGKINADILIQGSSRAWVHVSPMILDSVLNLNSYNIGLDGYNFSMINSRYNVYRKQNIKPKYIIQILDIVSLRKRKDLYKIEQFIPYLKDDVIKTSTQDYEGFDWGDYNIPLYRYMGKKDLMKMGLEEYFNVKHYNSNSKYKGYQGRNFEWDNSFDRFKKNNPNGLLTDIEQESVALFNSYLKKCAEEKIMVFLVYAPEYYELQNVVTNSDSLINLYQNAADKYNMVFFDYSKDSISYDKKLFYNSQHLNKKGSELFSKDLAEKIKYYIGQRTLK